MGKKKFAIFEDSDGTEFSGPQEYALQLEDLVVSTIINPGESITIHNYESLIIKRYIKIKGILRIEGTGILGVV